MTRIWKSHLYWTKKTSQTPSATPRTAAAGQTQPGPRLRPDFELSFPRRSQQPDIERQHRKNKDEAAHGDYGISERRLRRMSEFSLSRLVMALRAAR